MEGNSESPKRDKCQLGPHEIPIHLFFVGSRLDDHLTTMKGRGKVIYADSSVLHRYPPYIGRRISSLALSSNILFLSRSLMAISSIAFIVCL